MPQYHSNRIGDSYVSLAQLCSTPAIISDLDMSGPDHFDQMGIEPGSPLAMSFSGCTLDMKAEQQAMYTPNLWTTKNPMAMAMAGIRQHGSEYGGSSPSDSPSPPGSVHHEQHQKRRAQNRAAQRAYRDRKLRYLLDLEQGIRDIEQKMMRLQNENTELIRELCEIRATNNDLRGTQRSARSSVSSVSSRNEQSVTSPQARPTAPRSNSQPSTNAPTTADEFMANLINAKPEELGSLYEPFAAMWNLIRMDPSVVQGKVSARTVLDRLRGMVEMEATSLQQTGSNGASPSDAVG